MIGLDGNFWSQYFRRVNIQAVRAFERAVVDRVLPAFANLDTEADVVAAAEYERIGNLPSVDDFDDMASAAEEAQETGLAFYEEMSAVRQALLNLFAAALFHMVEQQLLLFHRRQLLRPDEEYNRALFSREKVQAGLAAAGIELKEFEPWLALNELELVANVTKHGDGPSADKLRVVRPDVLVPWMFKGQEGTMGRPSPYIRTPLTGDSVFVTIEDFRRYADTCVAFWEELAAALAVIG